LRSGLFFAKLVGMGQRRLEQVTRKNEGVLEYGWRPTIDTIGDPTVVVWTTVATAPANYKAWVMNESLYGTTRGAGSGRWAVCPTCLQEFPISEMILVNNRYYCTRNRDAEELQSGS
jgi:hypothetical protein